MALDGIKTLDKWFAGISDKHIIIAGPCSAESKEQVLSTARQIKENGKVRFFRAGVWKPRTRPGSFEGIGEKALEWLAEAKQQTGLKTCVEVATPKHIKLAVESGVDALWIGARTVSNPFSVQELADALRNYDIPVMVKNPINPDIELWIGAIERIHKAGIDKIAAIHRGFYPFEKTNLRNIPKWEIPIELKTRYPNLPLINDPSHIAGDTKFIKEIVHKAIDINFDGLMIETHITPHKALSDSKQQITPEELKDLLNTFSFKKSFVLKPEQQELEYLREKIDSIDKQMLELLSKRMNIIEQIGEYKKNNNIAVFQLKRWKEIINQRLEFGKELNLSPEFIKQILEIIHKESIMRQIK